MAAKFFHDGNMKIRAAFVLLSVFCAGLTACAKETACSEILYEGTPFTICKAENAADIKLFLKHEDGEVFGDFTALRSELEAKDTRLVFAMNAGMYDPSRNPIGLYVEDGVEYSKLNTNPGPGNFHLLPNGVFWITETGSGVTSSSDFDIKDVKFATQSGPMLVIDNQFHPAFKENSRNFRIRNGVGQTAEGEIYFVKSDVLVNFHSFARLFRDELKTPNALYLDGTVSKLYSEELGRNDKGHKMGPIVGMVAPIP